VLATSPPAPVVIIVLLTIEVPTINLCGSILAEIVELATFTNEELAKVFIVVLPTRIELELDNTFVKVLPIQDS
jgi:hypothetical protein